MNKKAALELSVNSIVILIIAIAVLGLALGFIRAQFKKFDFPVETPEPQTPSSDKPITYTKATQTVAPGEYLFLRVKIFNDKAEATAAEVTPKITCGTGESDTVIESQQAGSRVIQGTAVESYELSIKINKGTGKNLYVCNLEANGLTNSAGVTPSTDVSFEVK